MVPQLTPQNQKDWSAWRPDATQLFGDLDQHVAKLKRAVRDRQEGNIIEHATDVANLSMKAAELAGTYADRKNLARPKLIVAFGSRAQVGKDTAYEALAKTDLPLQRVSFGDEMKLDLRPLFAQIGIDVFTEDPKIKKIIRPVMVAYAEQMKEFHPDYWVRRAFDKGFKQPIVICTDVRFPVEAGAIQQMNGVVVEIDSDVPYANETEAKFSPLVAAVADYRVRNDMNPQYMIDVVNLVRDLWNKVPEDVKNGFHEFCGDLATSVTGAMREGKRAQ